MKPITLYRDLIPAEKKEEKPLDEFLNKALDEAFDMGVDKSITVVEQEPNTGDFSRESIHAFAEFRKNLIEKLKALKK
jgi:hypothetical protein